MDYTMKAHKRKEMNVKIKNDLKNNRIKFIFDSNMYFNTKSELNKHIYNQEVRLLDAAYAGARKEMVYVTSITLLERIKGFDKDTFSSGNLSKEQIKNYLSKIPEVDRYFFNYFLESSDIFSAYILNNSAHLTKTKPLDVFVGCPSVLFRQYNEIHNISSLVAEFKLSGKNLIGMSKLDLKEFVDKNLKINTAILDKNTMLAKSAVDFNNKLLKSIIDENVEIRKKFRDEGIFLSLILFVILCFYHEKKKVDYPTIVNIICDFLIYTISFYTESILFTLDKGMYERFAQISYLLLMCKHEEGNEYVFNNFFVRHIPNENIGKILKSKNRSIVKYSIGFDRFRVLKAFLKG